MTAKKDNLLNLLFKIFLSLFMAVILFLECPFTVNAETVTGAGLTINMSGTNTMIPLTFFGNYTDSEGDRDSFIPYTYEGAVTLPIHVNRSQGPYYVYVSGVASIDVTFTATSQITGATHGYISASILSASLPPGMSANLRIKSRSHGKSVYQLILSFNRVDLIMAQEGSVTLSLSEVITAQAHDFGASYQTSYINVTNSGDFVDQGLTFQSNLNGYDPDISIFHTYFREIRNAVQSTYDRLGIMNTNILNQTGKIDQSILALNNQTQTNTTAISDRIKRAASDIILTLNNNLRSLRSAIAESTATLMTEIQISSNNIQSNADKNANDIMHSFDSTEFDSVNDELAASQKEYQDTEDSLFTDATGAFSKLDLSQYSFERFIDMIASLSFVSSALQSFYLKSGPFGLIVTISMVVMLASKVIGLYRFSTGSHSDSGGTGRRG